MNLGRSTKGSDTKISAGGLATPPMSWYRRPLVLSTMAVITLLVVTSSVFSVSLLARNLSKRAQQSHMINESLRIASGVSAELGLMAGYADLASAANTSAVVDASGNAVSIGISNLEIALDSPDLSGEEADEVRATGHAFVDAARRHAEALSAFGTAGDGGALVQGDIAALRTAASDTYAEHIGVLVNARDHNLDVLRETNSRMNQVGSAGGFVIAFLVPAAGLYLFEALRRNQGRLRLIEQQAEDERLAQRAAATEAASRLRDLNAHTSSLMQALSVGANDEAMDDARAVAALVGRATTTAMFNGAMQATAPQAVSLHELVQRCSLETRVGRLDVLTDSHLFEQAIVEADPTQLHSVLYELLQNAVNHGSGAVGLEYNQGANYDTLAIIDDGPGLPPEIERAVFDANSPKLRQRTRAGEHGVGLIVARAMTEANGGSLDYSRSDGLTRFTLVLPRSLSRSALTP